MKIRSIAALLTMAILMAGCMTPPQDLSIATDSEIRESVYRHDGPPALSLITVVSNETNSGAHSALLVNGSQRVLFDPAGSFEAKTIPERGDVLYGITPLYKRFYIGAHARISHRVVQQTIYVPAGVAEQALQLVINNGAVPAAGCTRSITNILSQLDGFESIGTSYFPNKARERFGALPGVTEQEYYETDDGNKAVALSQYLDVDLE
jgi:hypothetical protein